MIANFYIIPESLSNESLNNEKFLTSLQSFVSDYHNFLEFKEENKIIIQRDVFDVVLPNGKTLAEFLYSHDSEIQGKELSLKQFLSSIFLKLSNQDVDIEIIKEKIKCNSIENCFGIISLHKIEGLADENQVIYDKDSWYGFRRFHLGLYFNDEKYFIDECKKYYPKLYFHDNNYDSISKILNSFSKKIIFHLNGLNDVLPSLLEKKDFKNHTDLLIMFSTEASLDENASLEGSNKNRLKFDFYNKNGETESLVCEPHIKLCFNDSLDV